MAFHLIAIHSYFLLKFKYFVTSGKIKKFKKKKEINICNKNLRPKSIAIQ